MKYPASIFSRQVSAVALSELPRLGVPAFVIKVLSELVEQVAGSTSNTTIPSRGEGGRQ
ncbi:hypothetical protein LJR098_002724 [Rhizobium sp. LjRoot98]|uniref:hypothetical protein n=1 Tax=Rhizobium sp. LjRoot98 TaxID=3342345 RepID=UPI003ECF5AE6